MRESSIFHSCLWSGFGELAGVWVNLSSTRISKLPSKIWPESDLTKLEVLFYQFGLGLVSDYFRLSLVGMNVNPTRPTPTQPTQPELSPWGCPRIHACGHVVNPCGRDPWHSKSSNIRPASQGYCDNQCQCLTKCLMSRCIILTQDINASKIQGLSLCGIYIYISILRMVF